MTGPAWLTAGLAALMLMVAANCAGRLAIWRLRGRETELDVDSMHVLMGMAMAGMLEPRLGPIPDRVWLAMFAAAAAWFAWQAIRARTRGQPSGLLCAHPAPHAVESAAMLYMLMPPGQAAHKHGALMPGMSGAVSAAARNPAIAIVLALFMIGYIVWTTDRLAALSRTRAAAARMQDQHRPRPHTTAHAATAGSPRSGEVQTANTFASRSALAPRLAACYKIIMGIAMSYMLLTML